jgi:ribosomal protein S18 acetylase RimI-like enzyme
MTPLDSPISGAPSEAVMIRRAEIEETEIAHDAVWKLANRSPMSAHWSRAAFYPYVATDAANGALQAKALFLAFAGSTVPSKNSAEFQAHIGNAGRIVGFAAFSAIMTVGAGESAIENMAVDPLWQRKGVGRRLLTAGLLWCRAHAAGMVFLEVRASNRAAIGLYERVGFSTVGIRPGYYREPAEDGLQMRKILDLSLQQGEILSC